MPSETRWKEPEELADDELIEELTVKYEPSKVPACPVCGGELSIGKMGGGEPTEWACSPYEDDPDKPGYLRFKKGRKLIDDHYSKSHFTDRRRGGDSAVMELIHRFTETSALANLGWQLSTYAASVKLDHREKNTQEWIDGLIEKIERFQKAKEDMTKKEGK